MSEQVLPSFTRFLDALQNHYELVTEAEAYSSEEIAAAYTEVKNAFIAYDDEIYSLTEYELPFDLYDLDAEDELDQEEPLGNTLTEIDNDGDDNFQAGKNIRDIGLAAYAVSTVGDDEDVPDGEGQVVLQHIDLSDLGLDQEIQTDLEDRLRSYLEDDEDYFSADEEYDYEDLDDDDEFDDDDYDDEIDEELPEEDEFDDDDFTDDEEIEFIENDFDYELTEKSDR